MSFFPPDWDVEVKGIWLRLHPATSAAFGIEVERALDSSGAAATSASRSIAKLAAGTVDFFDPMVEDGEKFYYRSRHIQPGYTDGAFTAYACATPKVLKRDDTPREDPEDQTLDVLLRDESVRIVGVEFESVALAEGKLTLSTEVGASDSGLPVQSSTGGASTISKTIRFNPSAFIPRTSTMAFTITAMYLQATTDTTNFRAPLLLPSSATLTGVNIRGLKDSTADTVGITVAKSSSEGAAENLGNVTQAATGWVTTTGTFSEAIADTAYDLQLTLKKTAAGPARFLWAEVEYTIDSYEKAL